MDVLYCSKRAYSAEFIGDNRVVRDKFGREIGRIKLDATVSREVAVKVERASVDELVWHFTQDLDYFPV